VEGDNNKKTLLRLTDTIIKSCDVIINLLLSDEYYKFVVGYFLKLATLIGNLALFLGSLSSSSEILYKEALNLSNLPRFIPLHFALLPPPPPLAPLFLTDRRSAPNR
jgi:hypothetical protein